MSGNADQRIREEARQRWRPFFGLLDFGRTPETKAGWVVRGAVIIVGAAFAWRRIVHMTAPLLHANAPAEIPVEGAPGEKFRLSEATRREIFTELATAELAERARAAAANTWNGHVWSREDDRGHYERVAARTSAAKHRVSLSQVYLVLDDGIREHWAGPDGKPLPATTPPLNIRSNSW